MNIVDLDEYEDEDYDFDYDEWRSGLKATYDKETTQDLLELLSSDHRDFLIRNNGDQVSYLYNFIFQFEFLLYIYFLNN